MNSRVVFYDILKYTSSASYIIRKLSDFKNANIEFVQKSINNFDWTGLFKVKIAMNNAKST